MIKYSGPVDLHTFKISDADILEAEMEEETDAEELDLRKLQELVKDLTNRVAKLEHYHARF